MSDIWSSTHIEVVDQVVALGKRFEPSVFVSSQIFLEFFNDDVPFCLESNCRQGFTMLNLLETWVTIMLYSETLNSFKSVYILILCGFEIESWCFHQFPFFCVLYTWSRIRNSSNHAMWDIESVLINTVFLSDVFQHVSKRWSVSTCICVACRVDLDCKLLIIGWWSLMA